MGDVDFEIFSTLYLKPCSLRGVFGLRILGSTIEGKFLDFIFNWPLLEGDILNKLSWKWTLFFFSVIHCASNLNFCCYRFFTGAFLLSRVPFSTLFTGSIFSFHRCDCGIISTGKNDFYAHFLYNFQNFS